MTVSRRDFLRKCAAGVGMATAGCPLAMARAGESPPTLTTTRDAMHWEAVEGKTRCLICPNRCTVAPGQHTLCKTRINEGGKLGSLTYGRPCSLTVDPLAKNPLYHVEPGADAIVVATAGCNLTCSYCQNWDISQVGPWKTRNMDVSPAQLVERVKARGLKWLTFSYTEPVAYYEYAYDASRLARRNGIRVAICTAGAILEKPLLDLLQSVDAVSVTLKGYDEDFYRDVCGCELADVWASIRAIARSGRWMEVVTVIVPGLNDDRAGLGRLAASVARLDRDIPLHFLRFAPAYKLRNLQPTPMQTLEDARAIALAAGLRYVYIDVPGHRAAQTVCPKCDATLIERAGFRLLQCRVKDGCCPTCRARIPGMFAGV